MTQTFSTGFDDAGLGWGNDSPMTNRVSLLPQTFALGAVSTIAAFEPGDAFGQHVVTWVDWMTVFITVAGRFISPRVTIVPNESLGHLVVTHPTWRRVKTSGDYALEMQMFGTDTCGARLVNCDNGTVLQYQSEVSPSVTVYFGSASTVAMSQPVMTDEPMGEGAFLMAVEDDALAAMDEYERRLEERYRAAGERDARALHFDRN